MYSIGKLNPLKTNNQAPSPVPSTQAETFNESDIPELYSGVRWTKSYEGNILFINKDGDTVDLKGNRFETEPLPQEPMQIIKYFNAELLKRGWVETETAGGPTGEVFGYQKNNLYFTLQYTTLQNGTGPDREITGYKVMVDYNIN